MEWRRTSRLQWVVSAACALIGLALGSLDSRSDPKVQFDDHFVKDAKAVTFAMVKAKDAFGDFPPLVVTDCEDNSLYSWRCSVIPYVDPVHDLSNIPVMHPRMPYSSHGMLEYIHAGRGRVFHDGLSVTKFVGLELDGGAVLRRGSHASSCSRRRSFVRDRDEKSRRLLLLGVKNYLHPWYQPGDCYLEGCDAEYIRDVPELSGDVLFCFEDLTIIHCSEKLPVSVLKQIAIADDGVAICQSSQFSEYFTQVR